MPSGQYPRRQKKVEEKVEYRWVVEFRLVTKRNRRRPKDGGWEKYGFYVTQNEAVAKVRSSRRETWPKPYEFRAVRISDRLVVENTIGVRVG